MGKSSKNASATILPYDQEFYYKINGGSPASARICVPLILELLVPKSIVDIGCGQGEWLSVFQEYGIADYLGIDGDYIKDEQLLIPKENFQRHDLNKPFKKDRRFDLAISLEVGEHLHENSATEFVASLTRLADAVVFSAAVPGQGGVHHINEQWPWYWKERFEQFGYVQLDPFRQALWKNREVAFYYKTNLFLYVKRTQYQNLIDQIGVPDRLSELTLVRTTILQDLTAPGLVSRAIGKARRIFSRIMR